MLKEEVKAILEREPFAPYRIHLANGKRFDVTHRDAARFLGYGVLVFIGLKEGTRQANGYDRFAFEQIDRIEEFNPNGDVGGRRRRERQVQPRRRRERPTPIGIIGQPMNKRIFETTLKAYQIRKPFKPFVIELTSGSTVTVRHPEALVTNGGAAVYIDQDGSISIFDANGVAQFTDRTGRRSSNGS